MYPPPAGFRQGGLGDCGPPTQAGPTLFVRAPHIFSSRGHPADLAMRSVFGTLQRLCRYVTTRVGLAGREAAVEIGWYTRPYPRPFQAARIVHSTTPDSRRHSGGRPCRGPLPRCVTTLHARWAAGAGGRRQVGSRGGEAPPPKSSRRLWQDPQTAGTVTKPRPGGLEPRAWRSVSNRIGHPGCSGG